MDVVASKLTSRHFWQTFRLVGACVLADLVARAAGLPERYWALITAVVVLQPMLADTLAAGRDRVLGTVIGALVGFFDLELIQHHAPMLPLFWISFAALGLVIAIWPYMRLAAVTLIIVLLVPGDGAAYSRPFDRVTEILIGTVASILAAAIMRPKLKPAPQVADQGE